MSPDGRVTTDPSLAATVLLEGGIVGLPTETVYGLAAMALHEDAVHRVFDVKGRPRNHPLIVHLADMQDIDRWGHLDGTAMKLASALWPGPLTLLVPRGDLVPSWVTGGRDTVALRIPSHPLARAVLELVDSGVVAPSANRFGKVSPTTAAHVVRDLGSDVDLVLDGGPCTVGLESTIVECVGRDIQILRPGAVTALDVSEITGLLPVEPTDESRAPGMLISHYAPDAKVVLVQSLDEALELEQHLEARRTPSRVMWYDNVAEYALTLYDELRRADLDRVETIIAVLPPAHGLGEAVRDRLHKAAAGR